MLLLSNSITSVAGGAEFDQNHLKSMETAIKGNKEVLEAKGYSLNLVEQSLIHLHFAKQYKETFDVFFKDNADCDTHPQELVSALYLPVKEDKLESFFKLDMVNEFPKAVKDRLEILYFANAGPEKPLLFSDVFSRMYHDQSTDKEKFEVGNLVIKAFKTDKTWHILILSPALVNENSKGCRFKKKFRDSFIGKSQDVQYWLAIKAVQNKDFIDTLVNFDSRVKSGAETLAREGFRAVTKGGQIIFEKAVGMAASAVHVEL